MNDLLTPEITLALTGLAVVAIGALAAYILRRAKAAAAASETKLDDYILNAVENFLKKPQRK